MNLVELLQAEFGDLQGDETSLEYLENILLGLKDDGNVEIDELLSLLPMFEQAVGSPFRSKLNLGPDEDIEGTQVTNFCRRFASKYGISIINSEERDPIVKQRESSLQCESLEEFSNASPLLQEAKPPLVKNEPVEVSKSKGKGKRGGKKGRKSARTQGEKKTEERKEEQADWSTKRFEQHHQNWAGNENWKLQDHALTLAVDELDDDDYSSAWLECLRKGNFFIRCAFGSVSDLSIQGIPWGGRGAGGRGVQRVTGEAKDIKIPNVSMVRGTNVLLDDATLLVVRGKRYGIVGRNGVGKTTLLRRSKFFVLAVPASRNT